MLTTTAIFVALGAVRGVAASPDSDHGGLYQCLPGFPEGGGGEVHRIGSDAYQRKSSWTLVTYLPVLLLVSFPKGDISVKVGSEPILLSCLLNPNHQYYRGQGFRSDKLYFVKQNSTHPRSVMKSEVANATAITAWYDPKYPAVEDIECGLRSDNGSFIGLCPQRIFVGREHLQFN